MAPILCELWFNIVLAQFVYHHIDITMISNGILIYSSQFMVISIFYHCYYILQLLLSALVSFTMLHHLSFKWIITSHQQPHTLSSVTFCCFFSTQRCFIGFKHNNCRACKLGIVVAPVQQDGQFTKNIDLPDFHLHFLRRHLVVNRLTC